jgi:hypothetical protein
VKKTIGAWAVAIAFLLAYEAYAVLNSVPGDTLSEAVWQYGQHPMVAFAAGVLIGHFFWQSRGSSVVERMAHNHHVEGSIPSPATSSGVAPTVEQYAVNVPVAGSNPAPGATVKFPIFSEHFVFVPYDEDIALKWANLKWLRVPRNEND